MWNSIRTVVDLIIGSRKTKGVTAIVVYNIKVLIWREFIELHSSMVGTRVIWLYENTVLHAMELTVTVKVMYTRYNTYNTYKVPLRAIILRIYGALIRAYVEYTLNVMAYSIQFSGLENQKKSRRHVTKWLSYEDKVILWIPNFWLFVASGGEEVVSSGRGGFNNLGRTLIELSLLISSLFRKQNGVECGWTFFHFGWPWPHQYSP